MSQSQDVELLNEIYHDAKMGAESIDLLMGKVKDYALKKELDTEMDQFNHFASEAEQKLRSKGAEPEKPGLTERAGVYAGTQFNTLIDDDRDHLAEMMINGSTMGVVSMTKKLKECTTVEPETKSLANRR